MRRFFPLLAMILLLVWVLPWPLSAQDVPAVPTLVPPTPLPPSNQTVQDALITESTATTIQSLGQVRIGMLYSEPPFGELNIRGEVEGYDAALGRQLAEAWGVDPVFLQVTRQTAQDMLLSGQVDLLIAAQVHRRDLDDRFEFSLPYYRGDQAMMVRFEDAAQSLPEMANRRVGVVLGTDSEQAVGFWQRRENITANMQTFLTLDQAMVALVNNEVDGVVDKRYRLRDRVQPDVTRVLEDVVQPEPYAVVMRRQDINMRNLVDHTLQYLASTGTLPDVYSEYFPSRPFPADMIPVWANVGDAAPTPAQYAGSVGYPQQYAIPRIQSNGTVRIAGIAVPGDDAPLAQRRLYDANIRLIEALAGRWGVKAELLPNTTSDPIAFVERGEADLALGVQPDWAQANRVDFTSTYLVRGKRMLVEQRDDYNSFGQLRGKWVGVFADEPDSEPLINELAASANVRQINIFSITREEDAAYEMLVENNIDVIFGDSIRLLPHLEANPDSLKFSTRCQACDPWYTRQYLGIAVPRNDIDFRLLVEYTLQELWLDGTLGTAMAPVTIPGEQISFEVYPGDSDYAGFNLGQS